MVYRLLNILISFFEILLKFFMDFLLVGLEVVIFGDLNCNVLEDCYEGRVLIEFCFIFNFIQFVELLIRVIEIFKFIIDIVLMINKDFVENCVVKFLFISDYNLVCFNFKLKVLRFCYLYVII